MNLNDAARIIQLETKVENLQEKIALIEHHLDINYQEIIEQMREQAKEQKDTEELEIE